MAFKEEKVVILCGGLGTRMKEETEYRPKALVEIGGRPILWHLMRSYYTYGYRKFVLCLGYKGSMIKDYFLNYQAMQHDFTLRLRGANQIWNHKDEVEDWEITFVDTGQDSQTGARLARIRHAAFRHADLGCGRGDLLGLLAGAVLVTLAARVVQMIGLVAVSTPTLASTSARLPRRPRSNEPLRFASHSGKASAARASAREPRMVRGTLSGL